MSINQGILKGESGLSGLFLTRVNATGQRPHWPSRMEVSYCTFGFGAIIDLVWSGHIIIITTWFPAQ